VFTGVAAVLAKETVGLVLVGWALAHVRERRHWYPVVAAAGVGVAWMAFLRWQLPGGESVTELTFPFAGLWEAITDRWLDGEELWGLVGAASGTVAAGAALVRRGVRHPLAPAVLLQVAFLVLTNGDVLGNDFGAGRSFLPLLSLSVVMLFAPGGQVEQGRPQERRLTAPSQGAAGTSGPGLRSGGRSNS
jgi:hypothetical protein